MTDTLIPQKDGAFEALVLRLSRQSAAKHSDAYADIDWDAPDYAIDPADPRWHLAQDDPLAVTDWYRALPPELQSRVALHRMAAAMRTGGQFENILQRGLLSYAYRMPNRTPEFRFVHHEVFEESQHTLMFQEFVNRTPLRVGGIPQPLRTLANLIPPLNKWFPELFFMFVLGGEDPVDHVQRQHLRNGVAHPLLEQIMRIHVSEEARHLSFARHFLKARVPELGWGRRQVLALVSPLLFGVMVRLMVLPHPQLLAEYDVPVQARRQAERSPQARQLLLDAAAKPRRLCEELGLDNRVAKALWRLVGLRAG